MGLIDAMHVIGDAASMRKEQEWLDKPTQFYGVAKMKTNTMDKFTPGPWAVVHSSQGYSVGAQHKPNCFPKTRLCDIVTGTEYDAALIAAAPDLLAALEMALDASQNCIGDVSWEDTAIAAIARARGQV